MLHDIFNFKQLSPLGLTPSHLSLEAQNMPLTGVVHVLARWLSLAFLLMAGSTGLVCAQEERRLIAPHATNVRLAESDPPHVAISPPHQAAPEQNEHLLVWLAGTGGDPLGAPSAFLRVALAKGYRIVALSYPTTPAVAQVCTQRRVFDMPDCAERFRQMRVFGDRPFSLIDDRQDDAIVPRLTKLLQHLASQDNGGNWGRYLEGDYPRWERIVIAGQSQGGGMAAYLAKVQKLAGVLVFSGGWDLGPNGRSADWYRKASSTPMDRWHATYHVSEPKALELSRIYRDLGLPAPQTHALTGPVAGQSPHVEGVRNDLYAPIWQRMLP